MIKLNRLQFTVTYTSMLVLSSKTEPYLAIITKNIKIKK